MLFFGREEQTVELVERLEVSRFLAVVGSSGCGKSSLVRAGLVPKLKAGMLSQSRDRWLVATMKPGARPSDELAAALAGTLPAAGDAEELDVAHYEAVGGLDKALSNHAGEALADLGKGEIEVAEKLFRAVTTTEKNRRIRRPRTVAQLVAETGEPRDRILRVIDAFRGHGRSFLTPPKGVELRDDTLVDVSHESLIRQWGTLRDWVKAEAEAGKVYRRLADGARSYRTGEGSLLVDRGLEPVALRALPQTTSPESSPRGSHPARRSRTPTS